MAAFLLYIFKSTCCLILFYLGYKGLLSNDTFFRFNRWVLIGGMAGCLCMPFFEIKTESATLIQRPIVRLEKYVIQEFVPEEKMPPLAGKHEKGIQAAAESAGFPWGLLGAGLYFAGMVGVCGRFLRSFISLQLVLREGNRISKEGYTLILLGRAVAPFSWGKYVVLSEKDYRLYPKEILTHELLHLRQHHSRDLLFAEGLILFHWFNPAAWLLKQELQKVHEFQADGEVLKQGIDATQYQLLLVKKAVGASSYTFANSFNHSKIKKRITMMLKEKSNKWARLKLVLFVPVAACAMVAFARPDVNRQLEQLAAHEGTTISSSKDAYSPEFFRKELEQYIKRMNGSVMADDSRLDYLKEHTTVVPFFINAKAEIMYKGNYARSEQMPVKLKETLSSQYKKDRPVLIYFLNDVATPKDAVEKALNQVGEAFKEFRATPEGKECPVLLYYGPVKNCHSDGKPVAKIQVKFSDKQNRTYSILLTELSNPSEIRRKIEKVPFEEIAMVSISAPGTSRMGIITDIRQALRTRYNLEVQYKDIQM